MRPKINYANVFIHESDHSNGPEVRGGSCVFRFCKHLEHGFYSKTMVFPPYAKIWFMMPRRAVTTLSGAKCNNSATNPHSSEALFNFSRLMPPFNSCKLQFGSVKCNGWVGLPGCPLTFFDFDPVCRAAAHLGHRK